MELFRLDTRITLTQSPCRNSVQAVQNLLGWRVDAMMQVVDVALPLVRNLEIRIFAIGSKRHAPRGPVIPTRAEAGFPMTNVTLRCGLFGPLAMPAGLMQRFSAEANAWLVPPDAQEMSRGQGMTAGGGTPEAFRSRIAADIQHWTRVIREGGSRAD